MAAAPPYIQNLYEARLMRGVAGERQIRQLRGRLLRTYSSMVRRVLNEQIGGQITPARAQMVRRQIVQHLVTFRDTFGVRLDTDLNLFIERVGRSHVEAARAVAAELGASAQVATSFSIASPEVVAGMMRRRGRGLSATFKTFVEYNVQDMIDELDRFLVSSVARGVSADRFSRELATMLVGEDRTLRAALGARTKGALYQLDDLDPAVRRALPMAEKMLERMRTIAISETNNAHYETHRYAMQESPVVSVGKWELSGRHAGLRSSPDECDVYAAADLYGLGAGRYPPEVPPAHPHPRCACTFVAEVRRPEEWGDPNPPVPELRPVRESQIKTFHQTRGGRITDQAARKMTGRLNRDLQLARDAWAQRRAL